MKFLLLTLALATLAVSALALPMYVQVDYDGYGDLDYTSDYEFDTMGVAGGYGGYGAFGGKGQHTHNNTQQTAHIGIRMQAT